MNTTTTREDLVHQAMQAHTKKPKHWIKGSIKHKGAATRAAKEEGLSVPEWAEKHKHDSGVTGERAREALTFEKMHKQ